MYAINDYAINGSAVDDSGINGIVIERVTSNPTASPPRQPYLRLVALPTSRPPSRAQRAVFWRRRLVALAVLLAVVLGAWALGAKALVGSGAELDSRGPARGAPAPMSTAMSEGGPQGAYVVKQGDTLWAIARRLRPGGDVRPVVDRLADLRRGEPLRVGERIVLP